MPAPTAISRQAQKAAAQHGVSLAWRSSTCRMSGHDGRRMSDAAAPLIADSAAAERGCNAPLD